ncbi:uncharacterized protein LOC126839655 isoform X1 [Adelges cooleyi]|uniref:uncharacterized protein LOC126839655 isoform X1 n=1 Tax=Adelges cooleyi TaxID=133065 RepID=UPI00218088B7|nr:uncharacterized protein LOC126839655 isoform X1 [Adelges cooleyi]
MKLSSLLISFLFLAGVLADDESVYMDNIFTSTELIKNIYFKSYLTTSGTPIINGLEHIIEFMVDDVHELGFLNFQKLCFLIAIPDHKDSISNIAAFRRVPGQSGMYDGVFGLTQKANAILDQMIQVIVIKLIGYRPKITYTTEFGTLQDIANERRELAALALKSLIGRRLLGEQVVDDEASLSSKCRFLGIYLSTQSPDTYIKEVDIESTSLTCIFTDKSNTISKYRKIDGTWSQIVFNNQAGESLETQLQRGRPRVPPTLTCIRFII